MSLQTLGWCLTFGVLLHNLEEALYLPAWSAHAGRWYRAVDARTFRIAVACFSALLVVLTTFGTRAAASRTTGHVSAYLMAGYSLAMALNAVVPHALLTLVTRRYMPGTATGLLLNLPIGALYIRLTVEHGAIAWPIFLWAGPLIVLGFLVSLPLFFAVARRLSALT